MATKGKEPKREEAEEVKSKAKGGKRGETVEEEVKSKPKGGKRGGDTKTVVKPEPKETGIVLLWNINGPGKAEPRNQLVPRVVKAINPDVLLLQETTTDKLVNSITNRVYRQVPAGDKKESRVLYDSHLYEDISQEKIFSIHGTRRNKTSVKDALDRSVEVIGAARKTRGGPAPGVREAVRKRLSCVGLKRRGQDSLPENVTIFMSLHNYNTSEKAENRDNVAIHLCEIVGKMRELTGAHVVAGADFNCNVREKIDPETLEKGIYIPDYAMTKRRTERGKKKIDFIVTTREVRVQAHDFTGPGGIATTLDGKEVIDDKRKPHTFTAGDYDESVDHDPLVCTLTAPSSGCCIL